MVRKTIMIVVVGLTILFGLFGFKVGNPQLALGALLILSAKLYMELRIVRPRKLNDPDFIVAGSGAILFLALAIARVQVPELAVALGAIVITVAVIVLEFIYKKPAATEDIQVV